MALTKATTGSQIRRFPYNTLGHANHGWLDARHHFSFARYWNPDRTGFGKLMVINDDVIEAGRGFNIHSHENMEIITYVRQGAITHRDSLQNEGRTAAGDVQVMSAGSGVEHSEYNLESVQTRLYQIWILPNVENVQPRWDAKAFPKTTNNQVLPVLVSGRDEHHNSGALWIYQDAAIYGGQMLKGAELDVPIKHQAYVLASRGSFSLNGYKIFAGDGAEVTNTQLLHIVADADSELLVIDVPA